MFIDVGNAQNWLENSPVKQCQEDSAAMDAGIPLKLPAALLLRDSLSEIPLFCGLNSSLQVVMHTREALCVSPVFLQAFCPACPHRLYWFGVSYPVPSSQTHS